MSSAWTSYGSTRRARSIRGFILDRDGHRCQMWRDGRICYARADTVNHIIRREHGGDDSPANMQAACGPCNYGERTTTATTPRPLFRPTARQMQLAEALDAAGIATGSGRRAAQPVLARTFPGHTFTRRDIDTACAWRRVRGPLTRM
jgi:hypothetical protein